MSLTAENMHMAATNLPSGDQFMGAFSHGAADRLTRMQLRSWESPSVGACEHCYSVVVCESVVWRSWRTARTKGDEVPATAWSSTVAHNWEHASVWR